MKIKKLPAALLLSLPLCAQAVDGKAVAKLVSDRTGLKPGQELRVDMDRGRLVIAPGAGPELVYEVEFAPEKGLFGTKAPGPEAYEASTARFSAEKGLEIRTGKGLGAVVKLSLPVAQPMRLALGAGKAELGRLTGVIDAVVGTGVLEYDGSALPEKACVDATVKTGVTKNDKRDCRPATIKLHVKTGTVSVN